MLFQSQQGWVYFRRGMLKLFGDFHLSLIASPVASDATAVALDRKFFLSFFRSSVSSHTQQPNKATLFEYDKGYSYPALTTAVLPSLIVLAFLSLF